jgi:hypothetical protein
MLMENGITTRLKTHYSSVTRHYTPKEIVEIAHKNFMPKVNGKTFRCDCE